MAFHRVVDYAPRCFSSDEQQCVAPCVRSQSLKILIADEPTGNLDSETNASVIEIMLELNAKLKTALVLVTHDPDVARLTERTIRLRNDAMA